MVGEAHRLAAHRLGGGKTMSRDSRAACPNNIAGGLVFDVVEDAERGPIIQASTNAVFGPPLALQLMTPPAARETARVLYQLANQIEKRQA
jgi:hypothetical protein